jgi:hypothetical protein
MAVKFWNKKVLLIGIEVTYATDPTLTGAANAILAINVSLRPMEGEDVNRNLELPYFGQSASIPAALRTVLQFETELAGSGTAGDAPAWGPLLRAAGCAETIVADTSVASTRVSEDHESVWVELYVDGIRFRGKGARADCEIAINAQGIPVLRWTFTGLYLTPTDTANASPTLTGWKKPLIASKTNTPTFTVNGVALVLRSWSFKFGNQVEPRLLVGKEEIRIVDSAEQLDIVVETVPLATFNPFTLAEAQTLVAVSLVHGIVAGNICTIALPTAQIKRPTGLQNNQKIAEWPLSLAALPASGDDQFSITLT